MRSRALVACGLLLLTGLTARADDAASAPLPEPLTLADALRLASPGVPVLAHAVAGREAARADSVSATAFDDTQLLLKGRLWAIEPAPKSADDSRNDSRLHLSARKRLYDFGYTDALVSAADKGLAASELELLEARQQRILNVMRAFFGVVLSDLAFARDNEAMSVAFVQFDKARDRNELGQLSDVDLLEIETAYQEVRRRQKVSEQQQRLSRSRLAIAMGRPGQLVSELVPPDIVLPERTEGDFEHYWEQVKNRNPRLRALRARLDAATARLAAARSSESPVLSAGLDAAVYNRTTSSSHPLGGGLLLEIPLYSGGRRDAAIMQAQADVTSIRAQLLETRVQLRQEALQAWLDRERLRSDLKAVEVEGDYRDLYLDRSRALYELEVKTDLGDAMTRISELRLKQSRLLFDWAMSEARLKALSGQLLESEQ